MTELSILIPARNEIFLSRTIEDILEHIEGDTEVIAVLDGAWADPPIADHDRVTLVHHSESIGQRAATNEAAKLSQARFVLKADAHCSFSQGFDIALMQDCQYDWTIIPEMRNLHAFDWQCQQCGHRVYQGPHPTSCEKCDNCTDFEMLIVWKPRAHTRSRHMRFDSDLHFQYWREFKKRPEAQDKLSPTMSLVGACWMMHRERYWELGGMDERHGSWGAMGTEIACKSWLSGGQLMCSRKAWFAHLFRTQSGFKFPYPLSGSQVNQAREHSNQLWKGNNWEGQKYPLSWLLEKFWPIPGWTEEELQAQKESEKSETGKSWQLSSHQLNNQLHNPTIQSIYQPHIDAQFNVAKGLTSKGIVYYTDNRLDALIAQAVQSQIINSVNSHEIVSVSLQPIRGFGENIVLDEERGILTMFKQILAGLQASEADIIFFCEHDCLYHPSHFDFTPPREDTFYYNTNVFKVRLSDGHALRVDDCKQTSGLCAYRSLLLEHYQKRVETVEQQGFTRRMGFEPGTHGRKERIDDYKAESWQSEYPNIDIRHEHCLTPSRWRKDQFRNQRYTVGWTEASEVPGWGRTSDRFEELLNDIITRSRQNGIP